MPPLRPRRRAAVMLVGNHSAGKSSLANFLAGAHVQEESAPIETRGFTLITGASSDWGAAHTLLPQDRGLCEQFASVVRVQGRLALEQCPHVVSALAAAPREVARASLALQCNDAKADCDCAAGHFAPRGPKPGEWWRQHADSSHSGKCSALPAAAAARLAAVASKARWSRADNNAFRSLFEVAFVRSRGGVECGGASASLPAAASESALQPTHFGHLVRRGAISVGGPPLGGVDVIDTPGLVDGDVRYPFDPAAALLRIALCVDMIIVTMDPVGQSLCSRTLDVVRALDRAGHGEKLVFTLTRADTIPSDAQLAKLTAQMSPPIVRALTDTHGFGILPVWLPAPDRPGALTVPGWDLEASKPAAAADVGRTPREREPSGQREPMPGLAPRGVSPAHNELGRLLERISAAVAGRAQAALRKLQHDARQVEAGFSRAAAAQRARQHRDRELAALQCRLAAVLPLAASLAVAALFAVAARLDVLPASLLFRPADRHAPGSSRWSIAPSCGVSAAEPGPAWRADGLLLPHALEPATVAAAVAGPLCLAGQLVAAAVGLLGLGWAPEVVAFGIVACVVALLGLAIQLLGWKRRSTSVLPTGGVEALEAKAALASGMLASGRAMARRLVRAASNGGEAAFSRAASAASASQGRALAAASVTGGATS